MAAADLAGFDAVAATARADGKGARTSGARVGRLRPRFHLCPPPFSRLAQIPNLDVCHVDTLHAAGTEGLAGCDRPLASRAIDLRVVRLM